MPAAAKNASLPLARLLGHMADAIAAVRAGESLNTALAKCPQEARAGTQALAFHALRWLGAAEVVRRALAKKAPPAGVDALLLGALALLWPPGAPPYADHVLVDPAVSAARCAAASCTETSPSAKPGRRATGTGRSRCTTWPGPATATSPASARRAT